MSDNKSDFPAVPKRKHEPKSQPKIIIRSSASRHLMLNPEFKRFVVVEKGQAEKKPVILEDTLIKTSQPVNRSTIENDGKSIQLSKQHPKAVIIKNTSSKHASKLSNLPSGTGTQGSKIQSSTFQSSQIVKSKLSPISTAKGISPESIKMPPPNETKMRMKNMAINYKPATNVRCFKAVFTAPDGKTEMRTADDLINMIGEVQFDVLMSALLSVEKEDLRNRAILSFLTPTNNSRHSRSDVATQTVDIVPQMERAPRAKRKPIRKRQQPYALEENSKTLIIKKKIIDPFSYSDVVDFCTSEENQPSEENTLDLDNIIESSDVISHVSPPNSITSIPYSLLNKPDSVIFKSFEKFISTDTDVQTRISETDPKSSKFCKLSIENLTNREQNRTDSVMKTENTNNAISDFESSRKRSLQYINSTQNPISKANDTLVLNSNKVAHQTLNMSAIPNSNVNKTMDSSILNSNVTSKSITLKNCNNDDDRKDRTPFNLDPATYSSLLEDLEPVGRELLRTVNPEDWFHLATPGRLKTLPLEDRKRFVELQMYIDMKFCLTADEDNYLPIHNAVLNNDEDLLRRQCYILKANQQSIDIGDAEFNLSALQMCIKHRAPLHLAEVLLDLGACPLTPDDNDRSSIHLAAEVPQHDYLELLLERMAANPRDYLQLAELELDDNIEYDQQMLKNVLFNHAVNAFDSRGHTPLMVASDLGHCEHVLRLLEQLSDTSGTVNTQSPTSKDTALHLAVVGACKQAERNGDMSKVPDNYSKTISQLIRYGADPWIENKYGVAVNVIICEFRFQALFKLINTALGESKFRHINTEITVTNGTDSKIVENVSFNGMEPFIIVKKENGTFDYCNPKDNLRKKIERKDLDDEEKNKSKRRERKRKKSEKTCDEEKFFVDVKGVRHENKGADKINIKISPNCLDLTPSRVDEKKPRMIILDKSVIHKLEVETKKESNIPSTLPNKKQRKVLNLNVSGSPDQQNRSSMISTLVNSNNTITNKIIATVVNKNTPSTSNNALNNKVAILKSSPAKSEELVKSLDIKPMKVKVLSVITPNGEGDRKVTTTVTPEKNPKSEIRDPKRIKTPENANTKILNIITGFNKSTKAKNASILKRTFPNTDSTDTCASTSADLKKS